MALQARLLPWSTQIALGISTICLLILLVRAVSRRWYSDVTWLALYRFWTVRRLVLSAIIGLGTAELVSYLAANDSSLWHVVLHGWHWVTSDVFLIRWTCRPSMEILLPADRNLVTQEQCCWEAVCKSHKVVSEEGPVITTTFDYRMLSTWSTSLAPPKRPFWHTVLLAPLVGITAILYLTSLSRSHPFSSLTTLPSLWENPTYHQINLWLLKASLFSILIGGTMAQARMWLWMIFASKLSRINRPYVGWHSVSFPMMRKWRDGSGRMFMAFEFRKGWLMG